MAAGEKVAFEPALALVLAQHLADASLGRQMIVALDEIRDPLFRGRFEDGVQTVRRRLVGAEDAKVSRVFVAADHVAEKNAEDAGILRSRRSWSGDGHRESAKI